MHIMGTEPDGDGEYGEVDYFRLDHAGRVLDLQEQQETQP